MNWLGKKTMKSNLFILEIRLLNIKSFSVIEKFPDQGSTDFSNGIESYIIYLVCAAA